ncbi:IS3 family transposase [Enterococcus faecium]
MNVSEAGFYEFLKRKPSKRKKENELFKEEIATIFQEHHGRYGANRITKVLNKKGILVNRKRVGKLLHQNLSVFIDVYTKKIVGRSMLPRMKYQLVVDSFLQAFGKEQPGPELIIHTDQGSQYTGTKFQAVLRKKEARSNIMSRKGI